MIKLFFTEECNTCQRLKKWLDQQELSYILINVWDQSAEVENVLLKTGLFSLPIIEINQRYIQGFAPKKIIKELKKTV